MLGGQLHEPYLHIFIVVKLKEFICKCVIIHRNQWRQGANYETGALGVKICPGHAIKLFLSSKRKEGTEDTNHIQKRGDASGLALLHPPPPFKMLVMVRSC